MPAQIPFDRQAIVRFCQKWQIQELSLFGSVLRNDFRPDSDVDVLVTVAPESPTSYWDWADMTAELEVVFGRKVDLVAKGGLRNPFRRSEILRSAEVVHAA